MYGSHTLGWTSATSPGDGGSAGLNGGLISRSSPLDLEAEGERPGAKETPYSADNLSGGLRCLEEWYARLGCWRAMRSPLALGSDEFFGWTSTRPRSMTGSMVMFARMNTRK